MKHVILSLMALVLLAGCGINKTTAPELTEWHVGNKNDFPSSYGPLFYRGTSETHHYFICRAIDSFANFRVSRDDIEMDDIRPLLGLSKDPFPGYYTVDPNNGFKRIEK